VSELAVHFGVSRKTAHKWLKRYDQLGLAGLEDRSHAAHTHPNATPAEVEASLIAMKRDHPTWGPLKLDGKGVSGAIRAHWPAPSTRGAILSRAGLTRRRRLRKRVPPYTQPFARCDAPNSLWCVDFKGWFRTRDGSRCDPLTITDAYSRMLLCCQVMPRTDATHTQAAMERVFRVHGLPQAIRSDNGSPFASTAAGALTRLSAWWLKLGIRHERIRAGHPEQNGRHERMHLTLKQECCQPPAANLALQQDCFDAFRQSFNHHRPHQALGQQPPATLYQPSPRPYPVHLEDPTYSPDAAIRRVRTNGEIRWRGKLIYLSEALIGEAVAISETLAGYEVHFGPVLLGVLDVKGERLVHPMTT
jgi:transposase InsO family protein